MRPRSSRGARSRGSRRRDLLGEPNPLLIVDENGHIVAKSLQRIGPRQTPVGHPPRASADLPLAGQTIVIEPIIYDETAACDLPRQLGGWRSSGLAQTVQRHYQKGGRFFIQETWDSVTILSSLG